MRVLITILDGITETSMPYNEFVLYRSNHYIDEHQVLIICGYPKDNIAVPVTDSLEVIYTGKNLLKIRKTIVNVVKRCEHNGIPYAFHLHQVKSGVLAQIAMMFTGYREKTLFTVHSTFTGYAFHNKVQSFINGMLAQYVTCVSNTSYVDYPKIIKRFKGERVLALQNGVDTERVDTVLNGKKNRQDGRVRFIYVARMIPLKNHDFLLDVIKECKGNVQFIFVGAEDVEGRIRKRIELEGLTEKVVLTGLIPRNSVFTELEDADVYVSTSTLEGLPVSVLEAMYVRLPVILSDIPQHKEVVGDNEFARTLPFDKAQWIDVIQQVANLSQEQRHELGEQARSYVKDKFSLKAMHKSYDRIYEKLM